MIPECRIYKEGLCPGCRCGSCHNLGRCEACESSRRTSAGALRWIRRYGPEMIGAGATLVLIVLLVICS